VPMAPNLPIWDVTQARGGRNWSALHGGACQALYINTQQSAQFLTPTVLSPHPTQHHQTTCSKSMAQIYCGGPSNLGPWQCMGDSGVHVLPRYGMSEGRAMLRPSCVGGVVTRGGCISHNTNNKKLDQAGGHPKGTNALYMAGNHQHPTTHSSTSTMGVWGANCTKHCSITGDVMWLNHNM
jgi:hypothetical protein